MCGLRLGAVVDKQGAHHTELDEEGKRRRLTFSLIAGPSSARSSPSAASSVPTA